MIRGAWKCFNVFLLLLLPTPLFVVAAVSVTPDRFLAFPPTGFSLVWYEAFLANPDWMRALGVSALIALCAASLSTAAAVGAALALERARAQRRALAETVILAPLIFPHAAVGVAMLGFLLTLHLNGTALGILIVHAILCGPFAYRPIAVSLQKIDPAMTEAAMSLGADGREAFWRVTLPLMRPGIVTSLLFTFIISFDEVTVTLFLISPNIVTLPVKIWGHIRDNADPVVAAISTLLVLGTLSVVIILERTVGLQFFVDPEADEERSRAQ